MAVAQEPAAAQELAAAQDDSQQLKRRFSSLSALSLGFVICNSWLGWSVNFMTPLNCGGGPGVVYGFLIATVAYALLTCGLAELSSAFPTSGGQYHAAYMVSSPETRAAASFLTGVISLVAWALLTVSAAICSAQMIMTLVSFFDTSFVAKRWQTTLLFLAVQLLCTAIPCFFARALPKLEEMFFWASVVAPFVGFVTLLATSHGNKQDAKTVFVDYENNTGWPHGLAFLIGVGQTMYIYIGTDGATHIAEEVPKPGRNIPWVLCLTVLIGFVTMTPFGLAVLFSASDLGAVANSLVPLLEVFYQATGSQGAAGFYGLCTLILYMGATLSCQTTTGRLAWAFARDNGLPFSATLAKVDPRLEMPANATAASSVFCMLCGLIYLASSTAYNSFVSVSVLALNISCTIPQGIVLVRGRDRTLPERDFDLGGFGWFCNLFSVSWMSLYTVVFCLPLYLPVKADNMNYVSGVLVGLGLLTAALWFGGKRRDYTGPTVQMPAGVVGMRKQDKAGVVLSIRESR